MIRLRTFAAATLSLVALLAALPVAAQTQTGSLVFEVKDTDGNPLAGATILLDSDRLQGTQVRDTDTFGRARFPLLPPGDYTADISLSGYLTLRNQIQVGLGSERIERVVMAKGEMTEEVAVVAAKPIDTTETGTTKVYSSKVIQAVQIGSGNRSYQDVLQNAAGVGGGANPAVRGGTLGENRYLIDGVDTTDPVTGTFGLNTNFDSIEQVELSTGGFEAMYGRATGGIVNLVTKTGGNTFDGTADVRYYDESFIDNTPHFTPEAPQEFKRFDFTLGGPVVKDKVWFFLAYTKNENSLGIANAAGPRIFEGEFYLAKFTFQLNPDHRLSIQHTGDPAEVTNANAGALVDATAHYKQEQGADFTSLNYWGRLGDQWSLTARVGDYKSELNAYPTLPNWRAIDGGPPALIDDATGRQFQNYSDAQFSQRNNRQYAWDLTFDTATKRRHEITWGMDLLKPNFEFRREQPGGAEDHVDSSYSDPTRVINRNILLSAGLTNDTGKSESYFVQDRWYVSPRVTLRYGLRYEKMSLNRDDGKSVMDINLVMPRFGAAFDPKGDGKTAVTFAVGRFMEAQILTIANVVNARADGTRVEYDEQYLVDAFGFDPADADLNGDGAVTPTLSLYGVFGGPGGSYIDPAVKAPYTDEFEAGYKYALRDNMVLGAKVVMRHTYRIIEDTLDDATGLYAIKNIDELQRRYKGLEVEYNWDGRRSHVNGNWTYGAAKGNVEYTQHLGVDWDVLPVHSVNRFGWLSTDARHRVKVQGWTDLPKNWQLGYNLLWRSGLPYNYTRSTSPYGSRFAEPRGSRRLPGLRQLDAEVRKKFDFGPANLSLIGSITNLLNENYVTSRTVRRDAANSPPGSDFPVIETDTGYQSPRTYELGLRVEF